MEYFKTKEYLATKPNEDIKTLTHFYDISFSQNRDDLLWQIAINVVSGHTRAPMPINTIKTPLKVDEYFDLTKPLGTGTYGLVYLAKQIKPISSFMSDKDVALKFIMMGGVSEGEILQQLSHSPCHPNIACYYTSFYGSSEKKFYAESMLIIVMEYIQGMPIVSYLKKLQTPIPYTKIVGFAHSLLSTLRYIHKHEIAHADLGIHNIMITPDGRLIFIDFGFACSKTGQFACKVNFLAEKYEDIGAIMFVIERLLEKSSDVDFKTSKLYKFVKDTTSIYTDDVEEILKKFENKFNY